MPAPSASVIAAMRAGTAKRHLLFYLDHPLGVVRAWDGIGDLVYGGDTYKGVGGLARIRNVSDSVEIQDHDVTVEVSGVTYSALRADDGDIAGRTATVRALLLQESGAVLDTRLIFSGVGRRMRIQADDDTLTLVLELRGLMHDWSAAPRVYYTDVDQKRLFAADTGFSLVAALQDAVVSGWSKNPENIGSDVRARILTSPDLTLSGTNKGTALHASGVPRAIGEHTNGPNAYFTRFTGPLLRYAASSSPFIEEGTGAEISLVDATSAYIIGTGGLSGNPLYVDINGDVRTAGGKKVWISADSNRLRLAGAISSLGTATADTCVVQALGSGVLLRRSSSAALSLTGSDWTGLIFDNSDGRAVLGNASPATSGTIELSGGGTTTYTYVEDVSGTNATSGGVGTTLQVGGVDCKVSTTGAVISAAGRRIIRQGADGTRYFLRVWT